jgi:hypothetical protein
MEGIVMINNYPIEQEHQHEHPKFSYKYYIATSDELTANITSSDLSADVEIEMSRSIYDMRRAFKRTVKKLRNFYANKEPKAQAYRFEYATPTRLRFAKRRAMG